MRKFLFVFVLVLSLNFTFSQDTNIIKYLPLKIGNSWTYYFSGGYPPTSYRFVSRVLRDTIINSHMYFFISNPHYLIEYNNVTSVRIDSTDGNIYAHYPSTCPPNGVVLWDSLNSQLNNSFVACVNFPTPYRTCEQIGSMTLFSIVRPFKSFSALSSWQARRKYVNGFGIAYSFIGELHPEIYTLIGCVIDGVVFGDTSLVGINQTSSEVPDKFSLSQNYPNPFNPTTKILFSIPLSRGVSEGRGVLTKLIVYDALGREMQTLVNENLLPGEYEVDFDGINFSSGVYYYTLSAGDYFETKKMILIK